MTRKDIEQAAHLRLFHWLRTTLWSPPANAETILPATFKSIRFSFVTMVLTREEEAEQFKMFRGLVLDLQTRITGHRDRELTDVITSEDFDPAPYGLVLNDIESRMRLVPVVDGPNNWYFATWLHILAAALQPQDGNLVHLEMARQILQLKDVVDQYGSRQYAHPVSHYHDSWQEMNLVVDALEQRQQELMDRIGIGQLQGTDEPGDYSPDRPSPSFSISEWTTHTASSDYSSDSFVSAEDRDHEVGEAGETGVADGNSSDEAMDGAQDDSETQTRSRMARVEERQTRQVVAEDDEGVAFVNWRE